MKADDELLQVFVAEVEEQLESLAIALEEPSSAWDLHDLFRRVHTVKGAARLVGAAAVEEIAHALEDVLVTLRKGGETGDAAGLVRDGSAQLVQCFARLEEDFGEEVAAFRSRCESWLEGRGIASEAAAEGSEGISAPESSRDATSRDTEARDDEATRADVTVRRDEENPRQTTLRVAVDRLDRIMALASDLVTTSHEAQSRLDDARRLQSLHARLEKTRPDLKNDAVFRQLQSGGRALVEQLDRAVAGQERISRSLQFSARQLRMVPVESLRTAFSRTVRQICAEGGKKARLRIEGGETEVDRSILEDLRDPLVHLVRNAVDHGIESPAARLEAGKPEEGTIVLHARSTGSSAVIEVRDDGRGIDLDRLRESAVKHGLVEEDRADSLSRDEIEDLVFRFGFSTAERVSETSGRGVGLNVVREAVEALGGQVRFEGEPGQGTTFRLRLPLTQLTTRAVMTRLGDQEFLIPASSVRSTRFLATAEIRVADGRELVSWEGRPVPLVRLERAFGFASNGNATRPMVVVSGGGGERALLVDAVIGEREVTVQRLSWNLESVPGVAGSAVLDGGQVVLVLDVGSLTHGASSVERVQQDRADAERRRQSRRILVVDDSMTSRTLIKNILGSAGFQTSTAVDGEEALSLLQDESFDLVVADVEMPKVDGLELTHRIRASQRLRDLPVVVVTSLGSESEKRRGAEAGASAYIVKGEFDQDLLVATVRSLV